MSVVFVACFDPLNFTRMGTVRSSTSRTVVACSVDDRALCPALAPWRHEYTRPSRLGFCVRTPTKGTMTRPVSALYTLQSTTWRHLSRPPSPSPSFSTSIRFDARECKREIVSGVGKCKGWVCPPSRTLLPAGREIRSLFRHETASSVCRRVL